MSCISPCDGTPSRWTAMGARHVPCGYQLKHQKPHSPDACPSVSQAVPDFLFPHRMKGRTGGLQCGERAFFPIWVLLSRWGQGEASRSWLLPSAPVSSWVSYRKPSAKVFFIQNQSWGFRSAAPLPPAGSRPLASHQPRLPQPWRFLGLASSAVTYKISAREEAGLVHGEPWLGRPHPDSCRTQRVPQGSQGLGMAARCHCPFTGRQSHSQTDPAGVPCGAPVLTLGFCFLGHSRRRELKCQDVSLSQ